MGSPDSTDQAKGQPPKAFQGESVEVDAIEPTYLRQLVRECIEQHIDRRALEKSKNLEKKERETAVEFAKNFRPSR